MAKKTKKAKSAVPYVQRIAQDDYLQGQLRNASARLRDAYTRTRRQRGRAVEDKKLYANLREAATSIRNEATRLQRKPEPKRRGRKVAAVAVAGGGTALLWRRRGKGQADNAGYPGEATYIAGSSAGDGAPQETPSGDPLGESAANESPSQ